MHRSSPRSLTVLLLGLFLAVAVARGELSFRHSEDFESFKKGESLELDVMPEELPAALFVRNGKLQGIDANASATILDGVLYFNSGEVGASTCYWAADWWIGKDYDKNAFTIELRVKIEGERELALVVSSNNETADDGILLIREDRVMWGDKLLKKHLDNTQGFHTYRLVKTAQGRFSIWRDGELLAEQEPGTNSISEDRFWFGDWGGNFGKAAIDYVRWDLTGAYCP